MKLFQLADDPQVYPETAGYWMVVSDDMEDELAGPFAAREEAEKWIEASTVSSQHSGTEA
jgi:hypothetical protein